MSNAIATISPSRVEWYVSQLASAGIEPTITSFDVVDEVYGTYPMCRVEWQQPSVVTAAQVPQDGEYIIVDADAVLGELFGWRHFVFGIGHVALDAIGVSNEIRNGKSFSPEIGETFWVVNPPGVGFMPTELAAAKAEVVSWPCQKWQRVA